mgnify:CR=1 FL=1
MSDPRDKETGDQTRRPRSRSANWILRERYQLLFVFLVACVLPFTLRYMLNGNIGFWDQSRTALYVILAIGLSHFLIGRLSVYPSANPLSPVIPSVLLGFALSVLLIMVGQLPHSRMLLAAGFVGTMASYGLIHYFKARFIRKRIALPSLSNTEELLNYKTIDWITISEPIPLERLSQLDGIVLDLSGDTSKNWIDFAISCSMRGISVYDNSKIAESLSGQADLQKLGDIGIDVLLPRRPYLAIKSGIDFLFAILLLPLASIILAIATVAIKIDSRGPAIFVQERSGYRGRTFKCYKLRSMYSDARITGPAFTTDGDNRITRVGRIIRKYRIDEIPQIFNIIKGDMSWIGPRPEALELAKKYEKHIPFYGFRHAVKPGITGWAAIRQGNVADVENATEKLRNDFFYIKNISLSLDSLIAVKTAFVIMTGFGSK